MQIMPVMTRMIEMTIAVTGRLIKILAIIIYYYWVMVRGKKRHCHKDTKSQKIFENRI